MRAADDMQNKSPEDDGRKHPDHADGNTDSSKDKPVHGKLQFLHSMKKSFPLH